MTGDQILRAMERGSTLHGSMFGFFLISPIDGNCTNVHNGAARALARRGRIKREGEMWVMAKSKDEIKREIRDRMEYFYGTLQGGMNFPNSAEGDILKMVHTYLSKP